CIIRNYPLSFKKDESLLNSQDNKQKYICYIGAITEARGIKTLVKALEQLNCQLLLAGKFLSDKLYDEVKNMDGWKKVIYYGQVGRDVVATILTKSTVGIVTLHPNSNFIVSEPNKLFEYMSVGLPIVASNFQLWKDIVEKNNCGLCVDPTDPNAIAAAIKL